ncbi:MAG: aspartate--tRNA(Asn) ligase [Candidatus Bathyarchaeia archaeon]
MISLAQRVYIAKAAGDVVVAGFIQELRDLGNIKFLVLRDRTGTLQVTAKRGVVPEQVFDRIGALTAESVVAFRGIVVPSVIAHGGRELIPKEVAVLAEAETGIPIEFKRPDQIKTSLDKRLDYRFLDLRSPRSAAVFKVQSVLNDAIHRYFVEEGFLETHTAKLVAQATESGTTVFPVGYFGRTAYLAQSPQFYKQMLMAAGFEKVYEVAPVFRAEKHHTPRHLCEYTSIDFEMSYIDDFHAVMDIVEGMVVHALRETVASCREELRLLGVEPRLPTSRFPRITVREAYRMLQARGLSPAEGEDLDPEGERAFSAEVESSYGCELAFLTEFPWRSASRPFYVMRKEDEPDWAYSFDLIWRGLEVTTGGQREHRYGRLRRQCAEKGYDPDQFQFYLDFFRYGVPPHGGSGTGLERLTMQLLGLDNIRESTLLPRDPERLTP